MEQQQQSSTHEALQQAVNTTTSRGDHGEPASKTDAADLTIVRESTRRPPAYNAKAMLNASPLPPEQPDCEGMLSEAEVTHHSAVFPSKAPSAPPLPEESNTSHTGTRTSVAPLPAPSPFPSLLDATEFVWLFEYGLEMDSNFLNSMERLDGMALPYGPAYLKGYTLSIGYVGLDNGQTSSTLATLLSPNQSVAHTSAGVWGMLFRVPRHVTERGTGDASLLDTIHGAAPPLHLYRSIAVEVHETQRQHVITCLTYLLSNAALQQFYPLTRSQKEEDTLARRLEALVRKLRLPEQAFSAPGIASPSSLPPYISRSERQVARSWPPQFSFDHTHSPDTGRSRSLSLSAHKSAASVTQDMPPSTNLTAPAQQRWLIIFACYLSLLLPTTLTLIILQSLGMLNLFQGINTPAGIPILVLIYGLLGGCLSSILTLRRAQTHPYPAFVLLTWFTRPCIGAVLALLTFLLLQSGIIAIHGSTSQHGVLFLLAGTVAGLCEHWLFLRR